MAVAAPLIRVISASSGNTSNAPTPVFAQSGPNIVTGTALFFNPAAAATSFTAASDTVNTIAVTAGSYVALTIGVSVGAIAPSTLVVQVSASFEFV